MEPGATILRTDVALHVWETKYRHRDGPDDGERIIEDSWRRVARAVSAVQTRDREAWEQRFFQVLKGL